MTKRFQDLDKEVSEIQISESYSPQNILKDQEEESTKVDVRIYEFLLSKSLADRYLNKLSSEQKERMIWFAKGYYTIEMIDDTILIYNLQVDMRGVAKNNSI